MELLLHQRYVRDEAVALLAPEAAPESFCDGDFYVLSNAILCFITVSSSSSRSYFETPSRLIWKPQRQDYDRLDTIPWFPREARETWAPDRRHKVKDHYLFARLESDDHYLYLGKVHLGSYGTGQGGTTHATFSLQTKLPRDTWLYLGGSLSPRQPLAYLDNQASTSIDLSFHQKAFQLLHLPPQRSTAAVQLLDQLEHDHALQLPLSVREWYSLHGAIDILEEICLMHSPTSPAESLGDDALMQRYATTAPHSRMLPIVFENQGVWHLAVPLINTEDPPVYLGYQEDQDFEWYLHAHTFSDFIWAWTWDYVGYSRDYLINMRDALQANDLVSIKNNFQQGPQTYIGNGYFVYDAFERYLHADQRITIMSTKEGYTIWFSAESASSMELLLRGPWTRGDLLEYIGNPDIEMQKMYLW